MSDLFANAKRHGNFKHAVASIIEEGKYVPDDMKPDCNDPTAVGTREMAEAICKRMAELG